MKNIPKCSTASLINGNWFIYNDGSNEIQIWHSNISGKEKVFVNNQLLSEKRPFAFRSEHIIKYYNINYVIKFETGIESFLKCVLIRDNEILIKFNIIMYIKLSRVYIITAILFGFFCHNGRLTFTGYTLVILFLISIGGC